MLGGLVLLSAVSVSIVGASGYSGAELVRILARHPNVTIQTLFANTSAGKRLDDVYPWFRGLVDKSFEPFTIEAASQSDLVFVALPSGEAMSIVPDLLARGTRVIDLGGDFRLKDPSLYARYYSQTHASPQHLAGAVYGLPELNRKSIAGAQLVANPGCYPTGAILPLYPLVKDGAVNPAGITISSLSGVSGAGRKASVDLSFVEVNETVKAYRIGTHQHIPEIQTVLSHSSGKPVAPTFVPHLIPITRGIYTSIFANLASDYSVADIQKMYDRYYGSEPFVRFTTPSAPEIRNVVYSNFIDIGFHLYPENNQLIILSTIDNLVKGAAGQAVQNMNIMCGFQETEGLK